MADWAFLATLHIAWLANQTRYAGLFFNNNPKMIEFVAKVKTCGICYQAHEPGIYDPNALWREGGEVFGL